FNDKARHAMESKISLRRFGQPDKVSDVAAFLALNSYTNNCILNLDGGLSVV
ncbi:hypothetical protein P152DRAFT_372886, partial [Eremomyces bilateralis CBS 781.70]